MSTGIGRLLPLLFQFINLLALSATAGFFYYSHIVYKRPSITETTEKKRLLAESLKPVLALEPTLISFGPATINIQSTPASPRPSHSNKRALEGKLHFATVAFSLEIRDKTQQELVEGLRPLILDQLVLTLGKKGFHDLVTVQGRYVLASDLLGAGNRIIAEHLPSSPEETEKPQSKAGLISRLFFTEFLIQ